MTAGRLTANARPYTGTWYLILGGNKCSMDAGMHYNLLASSLQVRLRQYILKPSGDVQKMKTHTVLPGGKEKDCFGHRNDVT